MKEVKKQDDEQEVKKREFNKAMWSAIKNDDYEKASLLIQNNMDWVNLKMGVSAPLHYACTQGRLKIAELLLKNKADVNAVSDDTKSTPLHLATLGNNNNYSCSDEELALVKLLIKNKASINARDKCDRTPLRNTLFKGWGRMMRHLVECGADVNAKDKNGKTPIEWSWEPIMTKFLKENGAKPNSIVPFEPSQYPLAVFFTDKDGERRVIQARGYDCIDEKQGFIVWKTDYEKESTVKVSIKSIFKYVSFAGEDDPPADLKSMMPCQLNGKILYTHLMEYSGAKIEEQMQLCRKVFQHYLKSKYMDKVKDTNDEDRTD